MSISSVKAAFDDIAEEIAVQARNQSRSKQQLLNARNRLASLPQTYSSEIAEVNGYTPTGAFETLAKDELAKLTTEFQALKSALEAELTALGVPF